MTESRRLVVVGQGYVGLPLAMRAVEVGFDVVGFDVDQQKVEGLAAGRTHIDDVTDADVAAALGTGRYRPTSVMHDVAGFEVAVITVPTPLRDGAPDLSFIESAGQMLAGHIQPGCTVVLESTTYPGTTEEVLAPILEAGSGLAAGRDFRLGFSPERIDPGNAVWNFRTTPKVVSGIDDVSCKAVQDFYDLLVDRTVPVKGTREAELTKLLENTFRHVNIALANELAVHSNELGIDIWEVIAAASTKPFGFMPFFPGPGVGGHCLPIDPSYLSWKIERHSGAVSRFVKIANDVNDRMPAYVVQRLLLGLNQRQKSVNGSRVLVLGLAYKKNSNDARETPATGVVEGLLRLGADVRIHDAHVGAHSFDGRVARVELTATELNQSDVVVLVTDHDDIDYDLVGRHAPYVFDTRHRMRGSNVEHL
ncbi:MAG: nucleotide sugar dehydrogenase [Acidimicrobiia bacterium]